MHIVSSVMWKDFLSDNDSVEFVRLTIYSSRLEDKKHIMWIYIWHLHNNLSIGKFTYD